MERTASFILRSDPVSCGVMSLPGQLAAGTCEIVTLDRDSSQPRRTIARQTARCACKKGQIAGTTRARPACVDGEWGGLGGVDSGFACFCLRSHSGAGVADRLRLTDKDSDVSVVLFWMCRLWSPLGKTLHVKWIHCRLGCFQSWINLQRGAKWITRLFLC